MCAWAAGRLPGPRSDLGRHNMRQHRKTPPGSSPAARYGYIKSSSKTRSSAAAMPAAWAAAFIFSYIVYFCCQAFTFLPPVYFSTNISKSDCSSATFSAMARFIFPLRIQPRQVALFISIPRMFSPVTVKSHKQKMPVKCAGRFFISYSFS